MNGINDWIMMAERIKELTTIRIHQWSHKQMGLITAKENRRTLVTEHYARQPKGQ